MTDATELAALADLLYCERAMQHASKLPPATVERVKAWDDCATHCLAFVSDHLPEIKSALASRAGGGWLPIESAPRDGARILLYCNWIGVVRGSWNNERHAKRPRPYWTNDTEHTFGKLRIRECQPYYWQPLPPPPAKAAPLPGAVGGGS